MTIEARARTADPETSHAAARRMNASGKARTQADLVLHTIQRYPGSTSRELAASCNLDRYATARRCADLRANGDATNGSPRKCRIAGTKAVTWWPGKEHQLELI